MQFSTITISDHKKLLVRKKSMYYFHKMAKGKLFKHGLLKQCGCRKCAHAF